MENNKDLVINKGICDVECSTDKISPKWVLKIKSFIRPFITYSWHVYSIIVTFMYFLKKIPVQDKDVVMEILYIELVIILFWFGERLARNIGIPDWLKKYIEKSKDKGEEK
jgi:hypothetical protein